MKQIKLTANQNRSNRQSKVQEQKIDKLKRRKLRRVTVDASQVDP